MSSIVVRHQDRELRPGVPDDAPETGGCGYRRCRFGQHQAYRECRAFPYFAAHQQLAAHDLGEQLGNRQSQSRPGNGADRGLPAALERLEDSLEVIRLNAHPGVRDFKLYHLTAIADGETRMSRLRVFDRVGHQVDENLPQALAVRMDVSR